MMPDDVVEMVSSLLEKARQNEIVWDDATPITPTLSVQAARITLPNATILIFRSITGGIYFQLINEKGVSILSHQSTKGDPVYSNLHELLDRGYRKIMRIDETLADVKAQINRKGPLGG